MTIVVAGDALAAGLRQAREFAEVRDGHGNVLGHFAPISPLPTPEPTAEEIAELERIQVTEGPGKTTREVFEHLAALPQSPEDRAHLLKLIQQLKERDECPSP